LYRHALAAREAALGSGHPETTATRIALAVAQARCGRMIEARDLLERAVLACSARACPAALQADLWTNLGSLYSLDGKPGRAEPLLRRALKRLEELVPPLDPRLVPVLLNRAITLRALRRAGEARRLEARARDIRRREARDNPLAGVLDASARAR
jgi:tetratricopeptide (TPR) repeat protein